MVMTDKQLKWLKSKKGYLSIHQIEKDLQIPEGTLRKYVNGERDLAEHWHEKVSEWVKNFKK